MSEDAIPMAPEGQPDPGDKWALFPDDQLHAIHSAVVRMPLGHPLYGEAESLLYEVSAEIVRRHNL